MMSKKEGENPKVVSSFKIDPELLQEAKELAYQLRVSYSSQVETLIKNWLKTHGKAKGKA
jgi:hypothetical protein